MLVNQVREEVDKWRESGYEKPAGVSETSMRLLKWWFEESHQSSDGLEMKYYFAQREAIETIIYLYEVLKIRDAAKLVLKYMDPKTLLAEPITGGRRYFTTCIASKNQ